MLYVYDNSTDVTSSVEEGSIQIDMQMSNRKVTARFSMLDTKISYGHSVYIYEGVRIVKTSASGTNILYVDDTFADTSKFRVNDSIIVDIKGTEVSYVIQSIDTTNKTFTLTTNLTATVTANSTKVGRLIFGGIVVKNSESEISNAGTSDSKLSYAVQCIDWTNLIDRKIVVQQYQNMYIREIYGRILYTFTSLDTSTDIDTFESAWTQSGTALATANESTDRLQGTNSQKTGMSGSGTALWTKTISSKNISAYTNIRWWWKVAAGYGSLVTAMKIRVGANASNYYEYSLANIGLSFEDCWNFESIILSTYSSVTGSPSLAAVTWVQLVITTTGAIPTGGVFFDHMLASTGGFTLQNTIRGTTKFTDVRVQYRKVTDIFSDLAKTQALFWYINVMRDIYLFQSTGTIAAPFSITDSSQNYSKLVIDPDITNLRNRVTVRGGEAAASTLYTQSVVADGAQTSFTLDYKPSNLTMTVAGVSQTLGAEGFTDETTVQWIYNFENRIVRKTSSTTTPAASAAIVFTYYPYQPIRVRVTSPTSIAAMAALTGGDGCYDAPVINDTTISTFADARSRGQAELTQYANAVKTANFYTETDGLRVGQVISITDTTRGISAESYLIQKIQMGQQYRDRWTYQVTASSTLFGIVEFIQMLLKQSNKLVVSPSELVDSIINIDETITATDIMTLTNKSKTFQATLRKKNVLDFVHYAGLSISATGALDTSKQWYGLFSGSETGTISVDSSTHYAKGKALKITTAVGGASKEASLTLRNYIAAPASTLYTVTAWVEIPSALTNVSSGGARLLVKEYDSSGTLLATNTIFSSLTAAQDFTKSSSTFTTNASTAYLSVVASVYQAAGIVSFADITLLPATTETATNPALVSFSQAS